MTDAARVDGGSLRLFSVSGIPVYLHWSWALVALVEVTWRSGAFGSVLFNAAEYVALFAIVLLHELGHALACRSVGGRADKILLWPLGGIAYVRPPQRPGALLWSIAAGPLVNLALVPLLGLASVALVMSGWADLWPDAYRFVLVLAVLNGLIFAFNIIPIYPLDGGQILHSLLWFALGRERSLLIASGVGLVGSVVLGLAVSVWLGSFWLALIGLWMAWRSYFGIQVALARMRLADAPARTDAACPACGRRPPVGAFWGCSNRHVYDAMEHRGVCPICGDEAEDSPCVYCGDVSPIARWTSAAADQREA